MSSLVIYCADIGSVAKGNFGWARLECVQSPTCIVGQDIREFASRIAGDLNAKHPVALGFECPLFIPVTNDPELLTSARDGEGNRAWSAGAGAASLATGLSETIWVLTQVQRKISTSLPIHFRWGPFQQSDVGLFIWEALVTGGSKTDSHTGDAELAVNQFYKCRSDPESHNAITCPDAHSLIGAALLQSRLEDDLSLLNEACLVIRAKEPINCVPRNHA